MVAPEQRRLPAIMFTDMVGYGALTQQDATLALDRLQEHHDLLRDVLPMFQGHEIKSPGAGLGAEFPNALAAVTCAVEIQRTLAERNKKKTEERQIQTRIGIHLGDDANLAARLAALAEPGGVCITRAVVEQVEGKLPQSLVELSGPELRELPPDLVVYKVVLEVSPESLAAADASRKQLLWLVLGVVVLNMVLFLKFGLNRRGEAAGSTNSPAPPGLTNRLSPTPSNR